MAAGEWPPVLDDIRRRLKTVAFSKQRGDWCADCFLPPLCAQFSVCRCVTGCRCTTGRVDNTCAGWTTGRVDNTCAGWTTGRVDKCVLVGPQGVLTNVCWLDHRAC